MPIRSRRDALTALAAAAVVQTLPRSAHADTSAVPTMTKSFARARSGPPNSQKLPPIV